MIVATWGNVLSASFKGIWLGIASFIPNLIIALVILILGWMIGAIIEKLIAKLITSAKLDSILTSAGLRDLLARGGINLNSGLFIGALVKWFLVITFLVASLEVLGLSQVNQFLQNVVLNYLPQVIAAVLILIGAVIVAEIVEKIVTGTAKAAGVKSANFPGNIAKWAIWVFAALAALIQLGIAVSFINTLFTGVIVAISLALGLSFGLGGQEAASNYIEKIRRDISNK
jgi:hypothetical protein